MFSSMSFSLTMSIDMWSIIWFISCFINISDSLFCYNCSSTPEDTSGCEGDFAPSLFQFNNTRQYLVNCSGDNAMCFVRSWSARAKHAWMVQRGCYQPLQNDFLPRTMTIPTRAMTCRNERLPEAEYKLCLCKADWCNSAPCVFPRRVKYIIIYLQGVLVYLTSLFL